MVGILRIAEANKLPKDDQFGSLENTRETCRLKEYVYMYIYIFICTHVGVYIYIYLHRLGVAKTMFSEWVNNQRSF